MNLGEIIIALELAGVLLALVVLLRRKPEPEPPAAAVAPPPVEAHVTHTQHAHIRLKNGDWVRHGSPAHAAAVEEGSIE